MKGSRFSYSRVGACTYETTDRETGEPIGRVWRTRTGWSAALPDGHVVVDDYPGSREVAANLLRMAHNETTEGEPR